MKTINTLNRVREHYKLNHPVGVLRLCSGTDLVDGRISDNELAVCQNGVRKYFHLLSLDRISGWLGDTIMREKIFPIVGGAYAARDASATDAR